MAVSFNYSFQSEWLKKQHSAASWLVIIGAFFTPVIVLIIDLVHFDRLDTAVLSNRYWEVLWERSWESMALMLLPMGIVLSTSLIAQLEFKNNTWKQLHTTPQKLTTIFFAKFAVIIVMLMQFLILFNIGIYLAGVLPSLLFRSIPYPTEPIPFTFFLKENITYFIDALPIVALQYLISLQFKNFMVPVGAGILLWFVAWGSLFWKYGFIIPYAYCGLHYLIYINKYIPPVNIHLLAIGYFIVIMVVSYLLYITKKEKG